MNEVKPAKTLMPANPEPMYEAERGANVQQMLAKVKAAAAAPAAEVAKPVEKPEAKTTDAKTEAKPEAKPAPKTDVAALATAAAPAEAPAEKKSTKAARESKELRASREAQAQLRIELEAAKRHEVSAKQLEQARELIKSDPLEAIRLLNGDALTTYQTMTDKWLAKDVAMQPEDPVQKKLKEIDPYIESLKKREDQLRQQEQALQINNTITTMVQPLVIPEKLECLFDFFNPEGKLSQEDTKKAVARAVWENGGTYLHNQLKGDEKELLRQYGNYDAFFSLVAEHLEKQLEQQIDSTVRHAQKLAKFRNRIAPTTQTTGATPNPNDETAAHPISPESSRASSSEPARAYDPVRRAQIDQLLQKHRGQ